MVLSPTMSLAQDGKRKSVIQMLDEDIKKHEELFGFKCGEMFITFSAMVIAVEPETGKKSKFRIETIRKSHIRRIFRTELFAGMVTERLKKEPPFDGTQPYFLYLKNESDWIKLINCLNLSPQDGNRNTR